MYQLSQTISELKNETVTLLQHMIQIPSENPPGDYAHICAFLEHELERLGFEVNVVDAPESEVREKGLVHPRRNVIARMRGKGGGKTLLFNAHVDTVPVGDDTRWRYPPFGGVLADGRIYGRGATDSKGRLTAYIMAAVAVRRCGLRTAGDIVIVATCDEETGGEFGAGHVVKHNHVTGDMVVVEGYSNQVIRAMAGVLHFRVICRGVSAHAGWKWKGVNAIEHMAKVIDAVAELQRELEKEPSSVPGMSYTAINVGRIHGGTKTNVVPELCELEVECRVIPEHTLDGIAGRIEHAVQSVAVLHPQMNVQVIRVSDDDVAPTIVPEDAPIIGALQTAVTTTQGEPLPVVGVLGQSDARWFLANGIPAINYGPGTPENHVHHPDEFMDVQDLVQTIEILANFAVNVVGIEKAHLEECRGCPIFRVQEPINSSVHLTSPPLP